MIRLRKVGLMGIMLCSFLLFSFFWSCESIFGKTSWSQEVKVHILKDVYILPAAELVTTKTHPDIIEIANEYLKVSVVPNRGRLVFDYFFKPTDHSQLYNSSRPSPTMTPAGYIVEFGGYYLSVPWNPRARQPYDLEYRIVEDTPAKAKVYLWGKDPLKHILMEGWITIRQSSSLVKIKVKLTNKGKKKWNIKLSDYAVIAPGGRLTSNSTFLIPTSKVKIGKSENEWMGKEGSVVNWPQSWSNWSGFKQLGSFSTEIEEMSAPFIGMINYDSKDTFIKLWEPPNFFDELKIWSWGVSFEEMKGGTPTANLENKKRAFSLSPDESVEFFTYFYALGEMENLTMANINFAGWISPDKTLYSLDKDRFLQVKSQVGASKNHENLNLAIYLLNQKEELVKEIHREQIDTISPRGPYSVAFKIKLGDLPDVESRYSLKAQLSDAQGSILFAAKSALFTVK
ncbi:MAG: hypothetical protein ACE5K3_02615 [bacterium]